jgi:hypothetical protein
LAKDALALTNRLMAVAKAHPGWVKMAVAGAALSAAVLAIGGGLALVSAGIMGFAAFAPIVMTVVRSFRLLGYATKLLTAAQWLLNGALAANPFALAIIGAIALAAAAYELYKHWAGVAKFFRGIGKAIEGFASSMYAAGGRLVHELAAGMEAKALEPIHAAERLAGSIKDFFVGHSPPPVGPLHQLNRVRIVQTIAESIKPGPMASAIRRVAQVAAVAVPVAIGAGAGAAMAARPGMAGAAAGAPIVLNYSPRITVNGDADPEQFKRLLRQHSYELMQALDREHARRARTELK